MTTTDDILKYIYLKEESLGLSCESSAGQKIHMKFQTLFSLKNNKKTSQYCLLHFLHGALRVNVC